MTHPIHIDELFEAALSGNAPTGALAAHLAAGCPSCEAELVRIEAWLAEFAAAAEPMEPSPEVAARLATRVRGKSSAPKQIPSVRGASSRPWALAAVLAAVAFGGGYWLSLQLDAHPQRAISAEQNTRLTQQAVTLAELRASLEEAEERLDEQDEELASSELELDMLRSAIETVAAEDVQVLALTAADPNTPYAKTRARVFWEWTDYTCVVRAEGLPSAAAGKQYILWVETEAGERIRVGRLELEDRGLATLFGRLPKDGGQVVSATITEEDENSGPEAVGPVRFSGVVDGV